MMYGMASDDLGLRIRRARERMRWTQKQLADRIEVGTRTVGRWERGESIPRSAIGALEDVLGVSLSEDGQPEVPTDPEERALWDVLGDMNMDPADRWRVIGAAREARRQRATG